jgi:hypothetical protein
MNNESTVDADTEARRAATARFIEILGRCKGQNIHDNFKSGHGCLVCDVHVKTAKHLSSDSHRRREICTELLELNDSIPERPMESLKRLRALLCTPSSSKGRLQHLLFNMSGANWSDKFKAGPHEHRGHEYDGAKLWFGIFLAELAGFCGSAESSQDLQMNSLKSSILAVIEELRVTRTQVALQATL